MFLCALIWDIVYGIWKVQYSTDSADPPHKAVSMGLQGWETKSRRIHQTPTTLAQFLGYEVKIPCSADSFKTLFDPNSHAKNALWKKQI